ncbi:hypothetical protein M758_3G014500 [Ceratodon purpureus]|nr:hypothetical protein M758_3G014500 [Ceratodon purpureus]
MVSEDFPPLGSSASWQERMEKQMGEMEKQMGEMEKQMGGMEKELSDQKELLFGFCEREIIIIAGEILKWSVKKQGESDGEGLHFFDSSQAVQQMVFLCCVAVGEYGLNPGSDCVREFKELSRGVIKARNATAHCLSLEALEARIQGCKLAIKKWPELDVLHPTQVKIISKYNMFKALLPESFQ